MNILAIILSICLFSFNVPVEVLEYFDLNENFTIFCSKEIDERTAELLTPYLAGEKKEYDAVLLTSPKEIKPAYSLLKVRGKGIAIVPYGTDAETCAILKKLGMKILYKEVRHELVNTGESLLIERAHFIFFERI